jgi:hypothetical protein
MLKDEEYSNNPGNEDELKENILDAVCSISPAQLLSAMNRVLVRRDTCLQPKCNLLNMVDKI